MTQIQSQAKTGKYRTEIKLGVGGGGRFEI